MVIFQLFVPDRKEEFLGIHITTSESRLVYFVGFWTRLAEAIGGMSTRKIFLTEEVCRISVWLWYDERMKDGNGKIHQLMIMALAQLGKKVTILSSKTFFL